MNMEWLQLAVSVLASLATAIPLAIKLVEYVQKAVKEKSWGKVLDMVMKYTATADEKFDNGADRKEWVLAMVKASADTVDYDIDMEVISKLIDDLCKMRKTVNAPDESEKSSCISSSV